jgi:hypothetical protein
MTSAITNGVFEFELPRTADNPYSRLEKTFFFADHMHTYFVANGEHPAFPDKEDLPRDVTSSFDNYYIPIRGREGVKMHRITLVRANIYLPSEERSCFVDGNLVFSSKASGKRQNMRVSLYNSKEWMSGAKNDNLPYLWFYIDGVKITAIANFYMNKNVSLWCSSLYKTPDHYGIFFGEPAVSVTTGNTLAIEEPERYKWCPSTAFLVLLWPIYILWVLLIALLWTPLQYFTRKCVVRDFVVEWSHESCRWQCREVDKTTLANPVMLV